MINKLLEVVEELYSDDNSNNLSLVMWAMQLEEYELARKALKLEIDQEKAGYLTDEIKSKREALRDKLYTIG